MVLKDASASHPEWVTQGARFVVIDYDDRSTLAAAFEGVDVVISTVRATPDGIGGQKVLADAAKAAGVRIFAPSEFGTPSAKLEGGIALKRQARDHLQEIGLPYAILYTGPFTDVLFSPYVSFCVCSYHRGANATKEFSGSILRTERSPFLGLAIPR